MWVDLVGAARQSHQAGDLVLTPVWVACSAPKPFRSPLIPTTIDLNRNDRGRVGNTSGELPRAMGFSLPVSFGNQFRPDGLGQPSDVATTDRDVGQEPEGFGGQLEGWERCPGVNDLGKYGGTVAVRIKSQVKPLGEKSPVDRRCNVRRVPGA